MLDVFRRLLREFETAADDSSSPALAVAALLAEAAHRDGDGSVGEALVVDRLLAALFDLDGAAASALRRRGEAAAAEAPDLVRFTRIVKAAMSEGERRDVLEALWSVVLADGRRDPREDALMRQVVPLLGLTDRDSALARRRIIGTSGS
jgi:uncharacterized tellurite resistance protein B-like protein